MAAVSLEEFLDQVRSRLGLSADAAKRVGKQIAKLELTSPEVGRLVDAVNLELGRIYAERHLAMHRIPHDVVETEELVDSWEVRPDNERQPELDADGEILAPGKRIVVARSNALAACPDCGRELLAARGSDARVPVLVCGRLEGLSVTAVAGLTRNDVVACGLEG